MQNRSQTKTALAALGASILVLVLAGCSKQPPECSSPEVGKLVIAQISEYAQMQLGISAQTSMSSEGAKAFNKYFDSTQVKFGSVVQSGYNEQSKARSCSGDITIAAPSGLAKTISIDYGTQMTSDGKDYVLRYPQKIVEVIAYHFAVDVPAFATKERDLLGDWGGSMICAPVQIQNPDGRSAGETAPANFKVREVEGFRNLKGIDLEGVLNPLTENVTLKSALPSMGAEFEGKLSGNKIEAKGWRTESTWLPIEGQPRPEQNCTISLTKGAASPAATPSQVSSVAATATVQAATPQTPAQPQVTNAEPASTAPAAKEQASPSQVSKPSFDCAKASTSQEKLICSSVLLGKLDSALAENYKQMLMADLGPGGQQNVKAAQKRWLSERNQCQDAKCLENSYRKRVNETCEYGVISGVHPACTMQDEIK